MGERPSLTAVIGMVLELDPHPKGVEWREQDTDSMVLGQPEEVIPKLDHAWRPLANRGFKVAMASLSVLKHEAHAGHPMRRKCLEVALYRRKIPAMIERAQLRPGDRFIRADRMPRCTVFKLKVGSTRHDGDPRELPSAWLRSLARLLTQRMLLLRSQYT